MASLYEGKLAYITGGSSGIGLSVARSLAGSGADVLLFARTPERLEAAVNEVAACRQSPNQRFSWMRLDVSKPGEVGEVMSRAVTDFGVPHLLINCAGRSYPRRFEDISYEQLDETLKINFCGVWNTTAALVPHMKAKGGIIVNVSSVAGLLGVFGFTDYSASKFAIVGFSEALRSELKPHRIEVAVLCPPDTDTPGFAVENRTKPEETRAVSAAASLMHPDDVAKALLKGIQKGRFIIHANTEGKAIHLVKRLFPSLVMWVMDRKVRKVQERRKST